MSAHTMQIAFEPRFTVPVNGVTYMVGLIEDDAFRLSESERPAEGFTDSRRALILVAKGTPNARRPAVFWHEFLHACLGEIGVETFANLVGCDDDFARRAEENLASYLGPILAAAFDGPPTVRSALADVAPAPGARPKAPVKALSRRKRAPTRGEGP